MQHVDKGKELVPDQVELVNLDKAKREQERNRVEEAREETLQDNACPGPGNENPQGFRDQDDNQKR